MSIGGLSKDCWIIIGTHCDIITRFMIASSCSKLKNNFYQCFDLERRSGIIKVVTGSNEWGDGLYHAARDGYHDLVDFFISKGACNWNTGLNAASEGGHRDLVDFFISKGATSLNWALHGASRGGHRDLVDFFVSKGADNWNWALYGAFIGGHRDLVDFFISKGAIKLF